MKLKRRRFFLFGSLTTLGAGVISFLGRQNSNYTYTAAVANTVVSAKPKTKDLLLRFVSVADTGTGDRGQYSVARAMTEYHSQNPYDLILLAGDNIYTNGEIEKINEVFERPYASLLQKGVKFQAVLGNHDIRTDNGYPQIKYVNFNMLGRFYTFRRDKPGTACAKSDRIQFFALDTNNNADWKNQLIWLENELSRSNAPWKIVYGHHPIYASGVYGNNPTFIKIFTPLFQKYGVQLYINGHEHHYERTKAINGTTYLICGGGAGTRPVGHSDWTDFAAQKLSFAAYEVYTDRIEISGIDTDNRIFDKGIILI
ncbi:metallophosphoesterase [Scytonema hofmannii PCC 7110]|uniref:Metallophosphoesterase n=1 Tax=Scytonema hofmannii PCC 7110 TaxID=128403 RepID=A0A139WVW0_9CYAN|nr:metallophosphoesterase [Scytonema hofmannii]KYC36570.1 metallophosphoesterase [Scytonema hofmannii PCC 7110]